MHSRCYAKKSWVSSLWSGGLGRSLQRIEPRVAKAIKKDRTLTKGLEDNPHSHTRSMILQFEGAVFLGQETLEHMVTGLNNLHQAEIP